MGGAGGRGGGGGGVEALSPFPRPCPDCYETQDIYFYSIPGNALDTNLFST